MKKYKIFLVIALFSFIFMPLSSAVVQIQPDPIVINVNTGGGDGNASSICAGDEVLLGNGTCISSATLVSNGSDSNETGRFDILTATDCGAGNLVIGIQPNGTVLCAADADSGGGDANIFDQELNTTDSVIFSGINITNASGFGSMFMDAFGFLSIGGLSNGVDTVTVTGSVDLIHVATENDDHASEIEVNTGVFSDIKALFIDYIVGGISAGDDEAVIFVNIDQFNTVGGDITGLEIVTTEGNASVIGLEVGVLIDPIEQLSGIFGDMDSALNNTIDVLSAFTSTATDVTLFATDDETVTIGNTAKFEEIEFILDTEASGAGIAPQFWYSTGAGTWAQFTPNDGTDGMRNTGVIIWLDSDIPSWAIGAGSEFLIRINRTRNSLTTAPIEDKVQIASAEQFYWNKDGEIYVETLNTTQNVTASFYIGDGSLLTGIGAAANETGRVDILTATDCTAGELVIGVQPNGTVLCATDANTAGANIFDQELNTTENVVFNIINSTGGWGNVTITESQVTDLVHTTDTNETGRVINLVATDCTAGNLVIGVQANGTVLCAADAGGGTINIFDQELNTTENVVFVTMNLTGGWSNVTITESQVSNLAHTTDTNETGRFDFLTNADCGAGFLVTGIQPNGTVLCAADADSGGGTINIFDQDLNTSDNVVFITMNLTGGWGNVTITESQVTDLVHTTDTNETGRVDILTATDCTAGELVIGVQPNGTVLCVTDANSGGGNASWNESYASVLYPRLAAENTFTDAQIYTSGAEQYINFDKDSFLLNSTSVYFMNLLGCDADNEKVEVAADGLVSCGAAVDTDTNETSRFDILAVTDCSAGNLVIGIQANGTVLCAGDANSGGTNIFDQELNTTENIVFVTMNLTGGWGNVTITESQVTNLVHTTDTNETGRFDILTVTDCSAGNLVIGIQANGTVLCAADADSGGGDANIFDQELNTTEEVTFAGINVTFEGNLSVGNARTYWNGSCLNTEVGGTLVQSIGCS